MAELRGSSVETETCGFAEIVEDIRPADTIDCGSGASPFLLTWFGPILSSGREHQPYPFHKRFDMGFLQFDNFVFGFDQFSTQFHDIPLFG